MTGIPAPSRDYLWGIVALVVSLIACFGLGILIWEVAHGDWVPALSAPFGAMLSWWIIQGAWPRTCWG